MSRVLALLAGGLSLVMTAACNRADLADETPLEPKPTVRGDKNEFVRTRSIAVDGCLSASGDQFVLAQVKPEENELQTDVYRLVGEADELRPHVGTRVRITGEAELEQVVDVREHSLPLAPEVPVGTSGLKPKVETTETARIVISNLQVLTVSPRGQPCAATR